MKNSNLHLCLACLAAVLVIQACLPSCSAAANTEWNRDVTHEHGLNSMPVPACWQLPPTFPSILNTAAPFLIAPYLPLAILFILCYILYCHAMAFCPTMPAYLIQKLYAPLPLRDKVLDRCLTACLLPGWNRVKFILFIQVIVSPLLNLVEWMECSVLHNLNMPCLFKTFFACFVPVCPSGAC